METFINLFESSEEHNFFIVGLMRFECLNEHLKLVLDFSPTKIDG
jgi:hypothetical protein